ncbi:FAD-binding and (Fe-S)-binding domain-containing protein [Hwangdonia lutea]|uniref:FAD-linked oxidase C-terminal domain-containing protein n=1 Tax=Hwangdonia lutea TaxID=3075823 RepID=A0AA97HQP2_9FLAO|nr:FAD-linked oxidase C-terminal domain-containing protein [Hwangdonia sp. SCSIO 19198]WOD43155.1 FAD-linked oxidase C-terminal domain-containing protein [Hwangdonia sp. SCSIO 19198]
MNIEASTSQDLNALSTILEGELFTDALHKSIYATDASVYRKLPLGVAYPKSNQDLKALIEFATINKITLIPRAAGTSLAGQCVGDGLVVDLSKHFTKIVSFNEHNKTITVQPGVIRDELNNFLKPYKLFFGPNTSTSNRCMIGGMVGNNSSGTTSIKYGVTRDKIVQLKTVLSDGSEVVFKDLNTEEFLLKTKGNSLESNIYKTLHHELSNTENQLEIKNEFPKPSIHRRNNGYAVDELLKSEVFGGDESQINLSKLMAGSEGTLAFTTEITLKLDDVPPPKNIMVAAHFHSIEASMKAVVIAMKHNLYTCELMDKTILDCTKNNREQIKNRFFVEGDPKAILMLEICTHNDTDSNVLAEALISDLQKNKLGYAYPKLIDNQINQALELRKAGLGLLGNIIGDKKAVACIEDTAVALKDLPNYIAEFSKMMEDFGQNAVYYAHAGAGELHLRPILNLKKQEDVVLFREITSKTAELVKKYGGSFSGEHGDGIVRAEFIPKMIGEKNYALLKRIKQTFDPHNVFNKGKIIDAFAMDENLRYEVDRVEPDIATVQDFSDSLGILRAAEKCNGSGDCRKLPEAGGTMCPSYRATKNEKDTTRARANALREFLTHSDKANKFNHKELYDVFDLCLSCKACASECPSNVDIATLKAEFLYQYHKENGLPLRSKLFGNSTNLNKLGNIAPRLTNFMLNTKFSKNLLGIAPQRSIPKLEAVTFFNWYKKNKKRLNSTPCKNGEVYLFIDEFVNFYDVHVGIDAMELLTALGYKVNITKHKESGRGFISKGMLDQAKKLADYNVDFFKPLISHDAPLVGIEPSAILTFRDEYARLAEDKKAAEKIAKNTFTIEEFLSRESNEGRINPDQFTAEKQVVKIHGHCHQKALSSMESAFKMLSIPKNYSVTIINSGCCGMAGSFGYEKEHYALSMQVGEDTLFPKIRNMSDQTIIVASGTSCRHQIKDGTDKNSKHAVSVLREALL